MDDTAATEADSQDGGPDDQEQATIKLAQRVAAAQVAKEAAHLSDDQQEKVVDKLTERLVRESREDRIDLEKAAEKIEQGKQLEGDEYEI